MTVVSLPPFSHRLPFMDSAGVVHGQCWGGSWTVLGWRVRAIPLMVPYLSFVHVVSCVTHICLSTYSTTDLPILAYLI
jgi:hypothetical protein